MTKRKREREPPREPKDPSEPREPRLPKKKMAVLMGYSGFGYQGMQINPDAKTIEGELHKAFAETGAVSTDNAYAPHKIDFMRAARTDKGVHALGQVVSAKLITEDPELVSKLNAALPDQIKVWGMIRTTNGFHSKNACDSRVYEYVLPTYILQDADYNKYPRSGLAVKNGLDPLACKTDLSALNEEEIKAKYAPLELAKATSEEMEKQRAYRIAPEKLDALRECLAKYRGSHNFHNFTIGKKFTDASAKRYIISIECSDPFEKNGIEWVRVTIHGQSFMLHQIRKMVGLAILCVRSDCPSNLIEEAYKDQKLNIPKAPASGLLLVETKFKYYNDKFCNEGTERTPVDFEPFKKEMAEFKENVLYPQMMSSELEQNEFEEWCRGVDSHHCEFEWYLTHDGIIHGDQKPPYVMRKNPKEEPSEEQESGEDKKSVETADDQEN